MGYNRELRGRYMSEEKRVAEHQDMFKQERMAYQAIAEAAIEIDRPEVLLSRILATLSDIFHFNMGTVRIFNSENNTLDLIASIGTGEQEYTESLDISDESMIVSEVARTKTAIFAPNVEEETKLQKYNSYLVIGAKSLIALPVLGENDNLLGVMSLASPEPKQIPDEFSSFFDTLAKILTTILERQRAKEALRKSEIQYQMLFEKANDAIFLMKFDQFIECNSRATDMFRCDRGKLLGGKPYDFSPEIQPDGRDSKEKAIEMIQQAHDGKSLYFEWQHMRCDGTIFDAEVGLNRIILGEEIILQAIVRDISERKKTEEKMKKIAETATLYLDVMGHDIRNQLQAILMGSSLLRELERTGTAERALDMIDYAIESCQSIITNVHSTEGLLESHLQEIDVTPIMERIIEEVKARHPDVKIEMKGECDSSSIIGDQYFDYLLFSIIENAVIHNPNRLKKIWINKEETDDQCIISVSDNGPGIPDKRKEYLFDATRRFGGVGLHQAYQIIQKYGGDISITDRIEGHPEKGVKFVVRIPKTKASNIE
ncbi:MAG: putative Histidine kinase [Candidatus Thorarchaeota archaeon]|nr:MAG: putative Histidine kinase [Candidatus Thorarchaeota archaeon]